MQQIQTFNLGQKLQDFLNLNENLLTVKEIRSAIEANSTEKFLLAIQKIFNTASFQDKYFEGLVEPDQILSGDQLFKKFEEILKEKKSLPEWEIIKPKINQWNPIENLNNSATELWESYKANKIDYQVVAQEIVEEVEGNKIFIKKLVYVFISGILVCLVYYLFWIYLYRSGRLGKMWKGLKSLFSLSKYLDDVLPEKKSPSSKTDPTTFLTLEETEDLLAQVQYFLMKELENDKLVNLLPADIYKVCLEADQFKNPKDFIACLYELFTKLVVKYSSPADFDTCTKSAIEKYSKYVVEICQRSPARQEELLKEGLHNIYQICIEDLLKRIPELKVAQISSKLANNYLRKYRNAYNKFKKSGKTWSDSED